MGGRIVSIESESLRVREDAYAVDPPVPKALPSPAITAIGFGVVLKLEVVILSLKFGVES